MKKKNIILVFIALFSISFFIYQPVFAANIISERKLLLEACSLLDTNDKKKRCMATVKREIVVNSRKTSNAKGMITFKGIPFDKPNILNELKKLCNTLKSNQPDKYNKSGNCNFKGNNFFFNVIYGTLSGTYTKGRGVFANFNIGKNKSLKSVTINPFSSQIPALVVVLTDKYGTPKAETEVLSNKLGAKFDNNIYTWRDKAGNRITINSIYGEINKARLTIEAYSTITEKLKETSKTLDKGKDNL